MNELSRSLIAAARQGLAPDAAVAARVRAKVAAAVGAGAAAGAASSVAAGKAATASAIAIKIGGVLLALGVVVTVAVVTRPADRAPAAPLLNVMPQDEAEVMRTDVRVVATAERAAPAEQQPAPAPRATAKRAAPTIDMSPDVEPAPTVEPAPAVEPAPVATPAPAAASPTNNWMGEVKRVIAASKLRALRTTDDASLAREVELIDLAMDSLKKRVPHAALVAIQAYERETHGRGQMAEDAAAIQIEALCNRDLTATVVHDRDEVDALIARFDRKWPESAQRERIQTACFAKP